MLQQDITIGAVDYKAGTVLHTDVILDSNITVAKDMIMKVDKLDADALIADGEISFSRNCVRCRY